jgi:cytochrome c oxidase cbb3-type subunit III
MKNNLMMLKKKVVLGVFFILGFSRLWGQAAVAASAAGAAGAAATAAAAPTTVSAPTFMSGEQMVPWVLAITAVAMGIVALVLGALLMRIAIMKSKNGLEFLSGTPEDGKRFNKIVQKPSINPNALPDYVVPIVKSVLLLLVAIGFSHGLYAQGANMAVDAAAVAPQPVDWSLTGNRLNFLILGVIFFELLVIFYFAYWLKTLLIPAKEKSAVKSVAKTNAWWDRFNKSVDIDHEKDVQLDHDYDGIKELNNALPPWWLYGFYFTILFAGVYLYRYHISGSAPLQVEELKIATVQAEKDLALVMASMANKVDETTIEYKPDVALIDEGKILFAQNCKSCHGDVAQGASIGPNLTDVYWIHGGGIKDIFKTIKHGVQEKGMIPWGQTLSNKQIAAVATFVKSLQGSNPVNAKAPQGQAYEDVVAGDDSSINAGSVSVEKLN